jgi:hypothetical protein
MGFSCLCASVTSNSPIKFTKLPSFFNKLACEAHQSMDIFYFIAIKIRESRRPNLTV